MLRSLLILAYKSGNLSSRDHEHACVRLTEVNVMETIAMTRWRIAKPLRHTLGIVHVPNE